MFCPQAQINDEDMVAINIVNECFAHGSDGVVQDFPLSIENHIHAKSAQNLIAAEAVTLKIRLQFKQLGEILASGSKPSPR